MSRINVSIGTSPRLPLPSPTPPLAYPSPRLPLPSATPPLAEQQFTDDNLGLMFGLGRGCSDSDTKSSSMFQGCCSSGYCIHMSYLVNKSLTLHVILGCPSKVSCCKLHKICFHHSFNHSFKFCQLWAQVSESQKEIKNAKNHKGYCKWNNNTLFLQTISRNYSSFIMLMILNCKNKSGDIQMTFMNRLFSYILYYQIFNSEYCISSVLIGSLNSAYQLILQVTLQGNALRQQLIIIW